MFFKLSRRIFKKYIPLYTAERGLGAFNTSSFCRDRSGSLKMPWQKSLGVGLNKLWRHPLLTLFSIIFTALRGREMSDRV